MFLQEKFDYTLLIVTIVCFALVIIILIIAFAFMLKRRMNDGVSTKQVNIDSKLFKATLTIFFDAMGGTNNVLKIDLDENKNCLIVQLEDVTKAIKLEKLANFNMYKSEIVEDKIYLYFADSKGFYNSLFGK
jgi:hypothetical protein